MPTKRSLRWFRFMRAIGGHANDWDLLTAMFTYRDVPHLQACCQALGLPWRVHDICPPQPEPNVPYSSTVRFVSLIPGTRWVEEPGMAILLEQPVFAWAVANRLQIDLAGTAADPYLIGPAQYTAAARIERELMAPLVESGLLVPLPAGSG